MDSPSPDRSRPVFARMYERVTPGMEAKGMAELRRELLASLTGQVLEVGAGNGMNFAHYPATVSAVTAVEPEPHLRALAGRAAAQAVAPVTVVSGRGERLPVDDVSIDAGVVSLMLCALHDPGLPCASSTASSDRVGSSGSLNTSRRTAER